jgi:hypothetical protein
VFEGNRYCGMGVAGCTPSEIRVTFLGRQNGEAEGERVHGYLMPNFD